MPWPDEALQAISKVTILKMDIDCSVEMKSQLIEHMATAHRKASEIYEEYSMRTDRYVCQTPKKYLHFLSDYDATYRRILQKITVRANETNIAIEVIKKCYLDVESMKLTLIEKETMLQESEIESHVLLGKLDELAWEVKKQSDVVSSMHEACLLDTMNISQKVAEAKDDLSKVQPLFDRALRAVTSIKPNDLSEMKKLGRPADIIKLIFDCVSILKSYPMNKVEQGDITFSIDNERRILPFLKDSYSIVQIGLLSDSRFLNKIIQFTKMEKDFINNETVEFMSPYMELECFSPITARTASTAAEGLSPDPMSFQNGLLATQSSQFPLIIDPQGQALLWITRHEQNALRLPAIKHTMVSDSRLEEQLEYCLSNGKTLIIIGVEDIIIPLLLPILEKGVAAAGENKNTMLSGRVCDNDDKFTLYLISSLPNPRISPAYQSICTLIDFTATSQSVEEQLLGRFIEKEQKSFEHSLRNVLLENAENSSMLQLLERQMLSMLSASGCKGSLIEDLELIKNLTHTKEMVRTCCAKVWCNI